MRRHRAPPAMISYLLELEPTDATLEYIGVDLDDMGSAMSRYVLRSSSVEEFEKGSRSINLENCLS
ncbi:MAG: hypothetical protein AB7E75_06670 [Candidatus Methanomethylophilaceae archaeon]